MCLVHIPIKKIVYPCHIYGIFNHFVTDIFRNSSYVLCDCAQRIADCIPLSTLPSTAYVTVFSGKIEGQKSIIEFLPFPCVFWSGSGVLLYSQYNNNLIYG